MLTFTSDQWVIVALIFLLGLVVGGFLFSGGGRKWKHRYNGEVMRRKELEVSHLTTSQFAHAFQSGGSFQSLWRHSWIRRMPRLKKDVTALA